MIDYDGNCNYTHVMFSYRLIVNGLLFPILTRVGYSMTWKDMVVISWGGLRGAVGLALALVVAQTSEINFDKIGCKVQYKLYQSSRRLCLETV